MTFKSTAVFLGLLSFLILSGCENTIQGFGKDMQHAGKKIQQSTDDNKNNNTNQ